MKRRQASVSQPHPLHQKQIIQSILKYVPLHEAARSARVSQSWRNATKEGFKFHSTHPDFCKEDLHRSWAFLIKNSIIGYIPLDDIREPRQSHLLEITNLMTFQNEETWSLTTLTQAPSNLKKLEFADCPLPTEEETLEFLEKVDVSQVEVIDIDTPPASTQVEHIINALPSLREIELFQVHIDFRRVAKTIETLILWANSDVPNLDGKVKILKIIDIDLELRESKVIEVFDLENIYGVEKMIWEMLDDDSIFEDYIEARCEELRAKLMDAVGTPLKTFVMVQNRQIGSQDLLREIEKYFELHVTENWDVSLHSCLKKLKSGSSLQNSQLVFKQIEK